MQINRTKKVHGGLISLTALTILAVFFIAFSTLSIGKVNAESGNSEASLDIADVIDISAPSTTTLNCTPGSTSASAQLCTSSANVSVTTNNLTGYTLYMNATSGSSNALTNSAVSPSATIPTLTQAYSSANFPANYWGYTGGTDKSSVSGGYNCASNYCPILAYQSAESNYAPNHVIRETSAPATTSTTSITFGGKVDITKPSGTYTTSVTFTAVANAIPAPPITNGMNMQDITSDNCLSTPTDVTYTVVDTRGGGTNYTVAKLQDGNCWMTQNLALGDSTAMNLTQADSNVSSSGFTLPASKDEWSYSYDNPEFFDYASKYPSQQAANKYGNYYNWSAATAGTNPSSGDSQYDICPKNWRLPSASTSATNSEFYTMLNHYISGATWKNTYWNGNVINTQFTNPPISLVFSGFYLDDMVTNDNNEYWWSSTVYNSNDAYDLAVEDLEEDGDSYVNPRYYDDKSIGNSIRCLIPGV
ncbi:hypothetical protein IJI91_03055 [Candidatus Saccharibacteria bacterium]|nr:hypothetical protein [Candidatus Saccharibacteria bacterium]